MLKPLCSLILVATLGAATASAADTPAKSSEQQQIDSLQQQLQALERRTLSGLVLRSGKS